MRGLGLFQHVSHRAVGKCARVPQNRDMGGAGKSLLEQRQVLGDQCRAKEGRACEIPAGTCEAGHEAVSDRIAHSHDDDRDRRSRGPRGAARGRGSSDDEIDLQAGELCRETGETLDVPICRAIFDLDVLAVDIAVFAQPLPKGVKGCLRLGQPKGPRH
jgi:hypothetical protein